MKKNSALLSTALLSCTLLLSCQKEINSPSQKDPELKKAEAGGQVWRAYKDSFDTYYFVVPDFANGAGPSTNFLPAWFPGAGKGNATHMGNAKCFFNQYTSFGQGGLSSVPASVNMFFTADLSAAGLTGIPANVSCITYDSQGNSVWFQGGAASTIPASPTRINFSSTNTIVGGTGRFANAIGTVALTGYFNPQDGEDASFWMEGRIRY